MSSLRLRLPEKLNSIFTTKKKVIIIKGGRSSGKSWGVAIFLLIVALQNKTRIVCSRETASAIDRSSYALMSDTIERSGLNGFTLTEKDITCMNGSEIGFMGLVGRSKADTRARVKGLEGCNYLWIEEAENTSLDMIARLHSTIRGLNPQGEPNKIIYTFNPYHDPDPVMQYYKDSKEVELIHIDYLDNPFCPDDIIEHAESLKKSDFSEYEHIYLGQPKKNSESVIFNGKFTQLEFDTMSNIERFYFGADWGFAQDPTTLVRCYILDNSLYIDYEAGYIGVDIDRTPALFEEVPGSRQGLIYADSARPETVSYMSRAGFNIHSVKKWSGSVEDGIAYLRSFDMIYVHPRCKKTLQELSVYSYKTDLLTGEIYPKPVDRDNHYIDAIRYALSERIRARGNAHITAPSVSLFA